MKDDLKNFILYTAPSGEIRVDVLLKNESVWLSQKAMAELFGVQRPSITKHLGNILNLGNLKKIQLVPFWNILPKMVKFTRQNFIISTP